MLLIGYMCANCESNYHLVHALYIYVHFTISDLQIDIMFIWNCNIIYKPTWALSRAFG